MLVNGTLTTQADIQVDTVADLEADLEADSEADREVGTRTRVTAMLVNLTIPAGSQAGNGKMDCRKCNYKRSMASNSQDLGNCIGDISEIPDNHRPLTHHGAGKTDLHPTDMQVGEDVGSNE